MNNETTLNTLGVGPPNVRQKWERHPSGHGRVLRLRCSSLRCPEVLCTIYGVSWRVAPGYAHTRSGLWVKSLRAASRLAGHRARLEEEQELMRTLFHWPGWEESARAFGCSEEDIQRGKAEAAEAEEHFRLAKVSRVALYGEELFNEQVLFEQFLNEQLSQDFWPLPAIFRCNQCKRLSQITGLEMEAEMEARHNRSQR